MPLPGHDVRIFVPADLVQVVHKLHYLLAEVDSGHLLLELEQAVQMAHASVKKFVARVFIETQRVVFEHFLSVFLDCLFVFT